MADSGRVCSLETGTRRQWRKEAILGFPAGLFLWQLRSTSLRAGGKVEGRADLDWLVQERVARSQRPRQSVGEAGLADHLKMADRWFVRSREL